MKRTLLTAAISLFMIAIFATVGFGHIISVEGQAYFKIPWHADEDEDFSFENPFPVTRSVQGHPVGPQESQAIFAYLTQDDFDVAPRRNECSRLMSYNKKA
jgi:hypothetical protein